jgi:hypothetical protein
MLNSGCEGNHQGYNHATRSAARKVPTRCSDCLKSASVRDLSRDANYFQSPQKAEWKVIGILFSTTAKTPAGVSRPVMPIDTGVPAIPLIAHSPARNLYIKEVCVHPDNKLDARPGSIT